MRAAPKIYRDENYADPVPAAVCPMCGEPVYHGDPCYSLDNGDLLHAEGVCLDYRERYTKRPLRLSCAMAYILDAYGGVEIARALQLEEKRWV